MNIVYTVNGEGMGHATRSSVIIDHLLRQGHRLAIFGAGVKPLEYLRMNFEQVAGVQGLHMVYRDNKVHRVHTMVKGLITARQLRPDLKRIKNLLRDFRPEVVITDFDFHGFMIAKLWHLPLVSIDNVQIVTQAALKIAPEDLLNFELNYLVARLMVPTADYYCITTFFQPELKRPYKKNKVFFVPPVLRTRLLEQKASVGRHILVYQTADSYERLWPILEKTKERYIIYNTLRRATGSRHLIFKPFSEAGLIADLASAKAVIVNGGFNLITEALYFGKPVLSLPIKNFYEQKLNALTLEREGLGLMSERLTTPILNEFLSKLEMFGAKHRKINFDQKIIFQTVDDILARCRKS